MIPLAYFCEQGDEINAVFSFCFADFINGSQAQGEAKEKLEFNDFQKIWKKILNFNSI